MGAGQLIILYFAGDHMQNSSLIKIIVAESHKLIKEGLILLLSSFQNFVVIDEAEDGYELISKCKKYPPDVVLVDLELSDPDSISAVQTIKNQNRSIKPIFMTATEDTKVCKNSIRKISNGIISKNICPNELAIAIQNVILGDFFLFHSSIISEKKGAAENVIKLDKLTKRENEILYYVAKGQQSKGIGEKLFLSPRTIDSHRSKIIQKYNLQSAAELIHFAHQVVETNENGNGNGKK